MRSPPTSTEKVLTVIGKVFPLTNSSIFMMFSPFAQKLVNYFAAQSFTAKQSIAEK
jgi:hypothetical protein